MTAHNPGGFAPAFRMRRSRQLFDELERTPDITRGETRLAAEVVLLELHGRDVPSFAHERAVETLAVLARG
jgi:hypothetical protein